jgi:hypothetical protein
VAADRPYRERVYECGIDTSSCSQRRFLPHQQAMQGVMDGWVREDGWRIVDAGRRLWELRREVVELVVGAIPAADRYSA